MSELAAFLDRLAPLVPNAELTFAKRGRFRGLVTDMVSGLAGMRRLEVRPRDGTLSFVVALPERDDLDARVVARAITTTVAIHRRFGAAVAHVRTLSFDQSSHGMAEGKINGAAPHHGGVIHLNASLVIGVHDRSPIAATVAHELWHKIEMAWDTEDYARSVEFRRAVGELFGCPTIEQVFRDPEALAALAAGVSQYATTNRMEATAEMFEYWWCGRAPADSIPARFGEIVERFFPDPKVGITSAQ